MEIIEDDIFIELNFNNDYEAIKSLMESFRISIFNELLKQNVPINQQETVIKMLLDKNFIK